MISNVNEILQLNNHKQLNGMEPRPPVPDETAQWGASQDRVTISLEAREASKKETGGIKSDQDLSDEEKQAVNQLKKRDAEVKAHERSHMSAGAGIVQGGASFTFQKGPDGRMYAVGGEVKIDLSSEGSPEATIRKMQQVKAAALAPAEPSGTDRAVAAQAAQIEAQARQEQMAASSDNAINPAEPQQAGEVNQSDNEFNPSPEEALASGENETPQRDSASSTGRRIDLIV